MPVSTWVEVDLDASSRISRAPRASRPGREILLVIKADAYGHGAVEIALAAAAGGRRATSAWPRCTRASSCASAGIPDADRGAVAAPRRARSKRRLAHELEPTVLSISISRARSPRRPSGRAPGAHATSRSTPAWAAPASTPRDAETFLTALDALPGLRARRASTRTFPMPTPRTCRSPETQVDALRAAARRARRAKGWRRRASMRRTARARCACPRAAGLRARPGCPRTAVSRRTRGRLPAHARSMAFKSRARPGARAAAPVRRSATGARS